MLILMAFFRLRAWMGALFSVNIHVCYLGIFLAALASSSPASLSDYVALIILLTAYQAFGFLSNDFFDWPYDMMAGKRGPHFEMKRRHILLVLVSLLTLEALMIFMLGMPMELSCLLVASTGFTVAYSMPPIRFKGRGFLGFLVDTTIEKPLPLLMIFSLHNLHTPQAFALVLLIDTMQFFSVLKQQIDDIESDLVSKTKTWAVRLGRPKAEAVYKRIMLPINIASIVLATAMVALIVPSLLLELAGLSVLVVVAYILLKLSGNSDSGQFVVASSKFCQAVSALYNSRGLPMLVAYLNLSFEVFLPLFLGLEATYRMPWLLPALLVFVTSLYLHAGPCLILAGYGYSVLRSSFRFRR